jgi:RNA polymerase-binding transcription factor DksA
MDTDKRKIALQSTLVELEKRLGAVTRDITKTLSSDFAEQATERENDDVLEEIARETQILIAQVKAALRRLENGSYGLCDKCREEISEARLDVLPAATTCINCAP